jgi:hypothetical protein
MRLKIVGSHPQAQGSECVIFGYVDVRSDVFTPIRTDLDARGEFSPMGRWAARPMRPGLGEATAPALVGVEVNGDACRTSGRLIVLSHSWSGQLQINNIARRYTVDLYSQDTRLVLLDLVNEIMLDVTALARQENGAIRMPPLTRAAMLKRIVEDRAWFRLIEPDPDFDPGRWRRALAWTLPRNEGFKLQIVSRLLPELAGFPAPKPAASPAASDPGLRDEVRLLAAALEGLALRETAASPAPTAQS